MSVLQESTSVCRRGRGKGSRPTEKKGKRVIARPEMTPLGVPRGTYVPASVEGDEKTLKGKKGDLIFRKGPAHAQCAKTPLLTENRSPATKSQGGKRADAGVKERKSGDQATAGGTAIPHGSNSESLIRSLAKKGKRERSMSRSGEEP